MNSEKIEKYNVTFEIKDDYIDIFEDILQWLYWINKHHDIGIKPSRLKKLETENRYYVTFLIKDKYIKIFKDILKCLSWINMKRGIGINLIQFKKSQSL